MKAGKVWGETELLLATPLFEIHRLAVRPYSSCSMHMHRHKWNCFLVVDGELYIEAEKNDYALTDTTHLEPGDLTTIPPGEYHRFRTEELGCVAYEIYYCEPLSADIVRKTVGSVDAGT